ncbi:MAG: crossover junction endodeoxyribonuclease RuvC [Desulfobacterota bacterium]|nr:crossover junction endodeoxyribonuclease RuvC [Thermodesulfobacteriota bacterium]MDW8002313.1 crossover junction endodeoxyribonuclease RuvC [Deltaproteobacteria bacterium]
MKILGVDPGLRATGYGAIKVENGIIRLMESGYIKTTPNLKRPERLFKLYSEFSNVLNRTLPDFVIIEHVFSLVRYPKAGITLGQVLGILYLTICERRIRYLDLTPKEIKNAITGYGDAKKDQIKRAVLAILGLDQLNSFHASDALAAAVAGFFRITRGLKGDKVSLRSAY